MSNIKFYITDNINEDIELNNITFPTQFTDVMDGSFDTGSFECILNLEEYNEYKDNKLREGEYIKRIIYNDNNDILDITVFFINEVNFERDSLYDEEIFKCTVKYTEATNYLTNLSMPNHTYTIKPIKWNTEAESKLKNSLYDVYMRSRNILYERNHVFSKTGDTSYRTFTLGESTEKILKEYPNKNATYLDSNFLDICRDIFSGFSSVPYYDAYNRELIHISSLGIDNGKVIINDEDKFVISNSYNRNSSNNADVIENKAVNIYEDFESMWYPNNIPLDGDGYENERKLAVNYVRPKGLNEGLEQYQYWYNWYLELPFNIERIDKVYYLNVSNNIEDATIENNNNTYMDVTNRIVEESSYLGLTETEKKYFAYYKKGSNRIENIVVSAGITLEDDMWPWDKAKDNSKAFSSMFAVKYKPVVNTDICTAKNIKRLYNKKNIVISNKNISDQEIFSKTNYELNKNYYGQYMIEIAGEYQNVFAGEIVEFKGFENIGIKSNKYLVYKVDTTMEKEGSHQIIYFNEMIAKNNVLLNEDNLVRVSQNPSYESTIERVFKATDIIEFKGELVNEMINHSNPSGNTYCGSGWFKGFINQILKPSTPISQESQYIKGSYLELNSLNINTDLTLNTSEPVKQNILFGNILYLNSGSVSQLVVKAMNNYIWDNYALVQQNTDYNIVDFKSSTPLSYTDIIGGVNDFNLKFTPYDFKLNEYSYQVYKTYYPYANDYKESIFGTMINLSFGSKDARETLVGVYEQVYCGDDDIIKLTDYFTSCTSSFMLEPTTEDIVYGKKLEKDILIFDEKIYNINSIDESKALKTIKDNNYLTRLIWDGFALYIDISNFKGDVGTEVDEYSFVIRGVLRWSYKPQNSDMDIITGGAEYTDITRVPQMVITVPKHVVQEKEYIKITYNTQKL